MTWYNGIFSLIFHILHFIMVAVKDDILTLMENISVVNYLKRQIRVALITENLGQIDNVLGMERDRERQDCHHSFHLCLQT